MPGFCPVDGAKNATLFIDTLTKSKEPGSPSMREPERFVLPTSNAGMFN
jgi:hypothetical protein